MRYYYLDSARILMMMLGVFYHAALLFSTVNEQMAYFDTRHHGFDVFGFVVHTFRMPAFFLSSGFLGALILAKYSRIHFLEKRTIRLALPFLVALTLVNAAVLHINGATMTTVQELPIWHLWFLPALMSCAILHATFFRPEQLSKYMPNSPKLSGKPLAFAIAALTGLTCFFLYRVMWRLPLQELEYLTFNVIDFPQLAEFFPFYFGGAVLYHYRRYIDEILRQWPVYLVITLGYFAVYDNEAINEYAIELWRYSTEICMTLLTLAICRLAIQESFTKPWMSNFSYTLYLFHLPLLLLFQAPVMRYVDDMMPRFFVVSGLTIVVCCGLHMLIVRSRLLSFLFNGESKAQRTDNANELPSFTSTEQS